MCIKKKTTSNRRHPKPYKLNWQLMILIETVKSVSKDAIELTRHSKSTDWICITSGIKNAKIIFIRHCFDRPFCPWYFRLDALVFGSSVLMNFKCMVCIAWNCILKVYIPYAMHYLTGIHYGVHYGVRCNNLSEFNYWFDEPHWNSFSITKWNNFTANNFNGELASVLCDRSLRASIIF